MPNVIAPEGQVFVCCACGRRSKDQYGNQRINRSWDESCMLNSILCYEDKLVFNNDGTIVIEVKEGGVVDGQSR
jgi:hypothetical protein